LEHLDYFFVYGEWNNHPSWLSLHDFSEG
jgi:hypothetical protein